MTDGRKNLLLTLAFAGTVLFAFTRQEHPAAPLGVTAPTLARPSGAPASAVPGRDNVTHDFRVETDALRQQVEAAPRDTTALMRLARLLQDAHRPDEAAAYYERYLALRPSGRQAWLDLANCYAAAGDWAKAREATQALLDRFPDDPAALYNMGAILANRGDHAEARRWWRKAAEQRADPAMAAMAAASLQKLEASPP